MRFFAVVLLVVLQSPAMVMAQNFVPNPSFENYKFCPGGFSESHAEFHVSEWRSANRGTPDHFHECSVGNAGVPHNWAGVSPAREGHGYVGLYLWMSNRDYREFIETKLTEPLIKDTLYTLQFYFKLSSYSRYSIDRIGLLLTDSLIDYQSDRAIDVVPTFEMVQDLSVDAKHRDVGESTLGVQGKGRRTIYYHRKFWSCRHTVLQDKIPKHT